MVKPLSVTPLPMTPDLADAIRAGRLLRTDGVAALADCTPQCVQAAIKGGRLPGFTVQDPDMWCGYRWLVTAEDARAWAARRKVKAERLERGEKPPRPPAAPKADPPPTLGKPGFANRGGASKRDRRLAWRRIGERLEAYVAGRPVVVSDAAREKARELAAAHMAALDALIYEAWEAAG